MRIWRIVSKRKIEASDITNFLTGTVLGYFVDVKKDANPQVVLNLLTNYAVAVSHSMKLALVEGTPKCHRKQIRESTSSTKRTSLSEERVYLIGFGEEHRLSGLVKLCQLDEVIDHDKEIQVRQSAIEKSYEQL